MVNINRTPVKLQKGTRVIVRNHIELAIMQQRNLNAIAAATNQEREERFPWLEEGDLVFAGSGVMFD